MYPSDSPRVRFAGPLRWSAVLANKNMAEQHGGGLSVVCLALKKFRIPHNLLKGFTDLQSSF